MRKLRSGSQRSEETFQGSLAKNLDSNSQPLNLGCFYEIELSSVTLEVESVSALRFVRIPLLSSFTYLRSKGEESGI